MKTILLIEDNDIVRENTAEILEMASFNVKTASDGRGGVSMAKTENPDLILCDIMMPELDGFGVIFLLSKNPSTVKIPFIFLSARADLDQVREGMNLGADDYLVKPFKEIDLLNAIERRLQRSSQLKTVWGGSEQSASTSEQLTKIATSKSGTEYLKGETVYSAKANAKFLPFLAKGKVKVLRETKKAKSSC